LGHTVRHSQDLYNFRREYADVTDERAGKDYRQTSFWLASTADDLTARKPLEGHLSVDVAILGGGYSGLWTAYYLLRDNPGMEVAVLEKDICGFGASGRNGGWCSVKFPVDADALERRVGTERARRTILAMHDSADEVGRVAAMEGIDAHYRNTGVLSLARGDAQLPAIHAVFNTYEKLGLGSENRLLSASEAHELIHATNVSGGLLSTRGASVHPGNLVRGLARAIEKRGGVIYEGSEVMKITAGARASLATASGSILARRAIVAAGEAYLTQLPPFKRELLPMSSMIVVTEPLTTAQWEQIGWQGGQSVASQSNTKNYLTRTLDGRILFGSRGAPYHFGSQIPDSAHKDERTYAKMRSTLREWFPVLEQARFTHAWGGYLGVPRDWMPTVNYDPSSKLARLYGYTGRGVSSTNLAARLVAGLISGRSSGLEDLPMHRANSPAWEREPLRWAAVRYVQSAFARIDEAETAQCRPPWDARIAKYLAAQ
jgi:glycine/D-amino acid oxidase-like deaminating enzyme